MRTFGMNPKEESETVEPHREKSNMSEPQEEFIADQSIPSETSSEEKTSKRTKYEDEY